MYDFIKENREHVDMEMLTFFRIFAEGEDSIRIKKKDLMMAPDDIEVCPICLDYHATDSLSEFVERYTKGGGNG